MRSKSILVVVIVLSLIISTPVMAFDYQVVDLGAGNAAYSINDSGQIVGYSHNIYGLTRACLFGIDGNNLLLGSLPENSTSRAESINNNGQIVGSTGHSTSSYLFACSFDPTGNENNINLGGPDKIIGRAYGINDNGQIVGQVQSIACLFDPTGSGNNTNLGTLGGSLSCAESINNNGQIVGAAKDTSTWHACLFDATGSGNNTDLGGSGSGYSWAYSINDSGQIVGIKFTGGDSTTYSRAYLFGGVNVDLGTLGGREGGTSSINDHNQIVGWADDSSGKKRACLFDPTGNGANIDLNTLIDPSLGLSLSKAYSINNNGWISCGRYLLIPGPMTFLTVQVNPNDIDINTISPSLGKHECYNNQSINLSAERYPYCPDVYQFDHWEGDVDNVNATSTTIVMDTDKIVTAVFVATRKCGDECHPNFLLGDLNHDCIVDLQDMAMIASRWLNCTKPECD